MKSKTIFRGTILIAFLNLFCVDVFCAPASSTNTFKTGPVSVMPDPTEDDGECRIYAVGHSFFAGQDDLQGLLPRMLEFQKGWKATLDFDLRWGEFLVQDIMLEQGVVKLEDTTRANLAAWDKIKAKIKKNNYDYFLFLIGIGGAGSLTTKENWGTLAVREIAKTVHELSPRTVVLGFSTWANVEPTLDLFVSGCDSNLDAWNKAASSMTELIKVDQVKNKKSNGAPPGLAFLQKRWQEGGVERFYVSPASEAWKIVYQEKGYGDPILLHRSFIKKDPHGNLWGDYLKTCVYYSMITGERFNGKGFSETLKSAGSENANLEENKTQLPDELARYLEDVAYRAVVKNQIGFGGSSAIPSSSARNHNQTKPSPTKLIVKREYDVADRLISTQSLKEGTTEAPIFRKHYDEKGNVTRMEKLSSDDSSFLGVTNYILVYNGDLLMNRKHTNEKGEVIGQDIYTYNNDGSLASERFADMKGYSDATYEFDYKNGKICERRFISASGALAGKKVYDYDENGRLSMISDEDGEGILLNMETYKYHGNGPDEKVLVINSIEQKEESVLQTHFRYDEHGHEVEIGKYFQSAKTEPAKLISLTIFENTILQNRN